MPKLSVALMLCLLSYPARSFAASGGDQPLRAAEEAGRRFVEAVNSGDGELRLATARAVYSEATLQARGDEAIVGLMERLAGDFGDLEFHHAEANAFRIGKETRHSLHVFVRAAKYERWKDLQFQLEAAPPHRIVNLIFIADVAEPVYLPNGAISDPHTLSWLDAYVDRLVAEEDLSGALLIAAGGRPLIERYFGFADSARTVPCSAATRFNLGSGNKMFTALALAKLVEEGATAFDTPIAGYLPELSHREWAAKATVGHLVSHTAGAGEYWTDATREALTRVKTLEDFVPLIEAAGIDFEPGTRFHYSNSNFILAGLVIERITGGDYHDFVRERISRPCGLADTDAFRNDGSAANLAEPLVGTPGAWSRVRGAFRGSSAGGGYSTARDMLRFSRCLVEGRIVGKDMLGTMTRSYSAHLPESQVDYGYGFIRETSPDRVFSYGHGGIARGVNFEYRYFPASDVTLVMFCNQDNGAYDSLRKTATRLITGER